MAGSDPGRSLFTAAIRSDQIGVDAARCPHRRAAPGQRIFFGDSEAAQAYGDALARLGKLGAAITEIDIEPFYETARSSTRPWLAERYLAMSLDAGGRRRTRSIR